MSSDIRHKLLNLIDDIKTRKLIEPRQGIEFIEEVSTKFLHENSDKVYEAILTPKQNSFTNSIRVEETILKNQNKRELNDKLNEIKSMSEQEALKCIEECIDFASFLLFTNLIYLLIEWSLEWLRKARSIYEQSSFLKFLHSRAIKFSGSIDTKNLNTEELEHTRNLLYESLKSSDSETILDALTGKTIPAIFLA